MIDDSQNDCSNVQEFLMAKFAHPLIDHASNIQEAVSVVSQKKSYYDVILLNLNLAGKTGQQIVDKVLSVAMASPLIILTTIKNINFSIKSIAKGVSDYLVKDNITASALHKSILYAIERKKDLIQLRQSEKRYSDLFNLSPQPMWVYEPKNLQFLQVNLAAIQHYGYSKEEFLTMTILDLRSDTSHSNDKIYYQQSKANKKFIRKDRVSHFKKSGERIEDNIYCTPISINDKSFVSVIAIDVTENNYYERKIIKAIIKTQENERYEFGSELHDNVCQILAASQVTLSMLKDSLAKEEIFLFNKCSESIGLALNEIRNLSHRLAPAFFDES